MTSRERVLTALDHREPDRVPIVIGASNATGLKKPPYRRVCELTGIAPVDDYIYDWPELGTIRLDEAMLRRLGSDVRGVWDAFPAHIREYNRTRDAHSPFRDDWAGGHVEAADGTWFPGVHPLADATTIDEIEAFPWPDMDDPTRVEHVRAAARSLRADGEFAVMATPWLIFPFERSTSLQGLENVMANMAGEPEFAEALFAKVFGLQHTLLGHFLDELDGQADIVKLGDDLGSERGPLMSPAMYRRMLKPLHAQLIALIRQKAPGAKVFFHSCGDVSAFLDDFVEIGVDILNPVQTATGGLRDVVALKARYGDNLSFCGAIDTQHVLPQGTPAEVRAETRRIVEALGPNGGYLLSAVHTVTDEVPGENVLAMVDEVLEHGFYPLGR
jgi:uroporphyrinogen decarboxylase